MLHDDGSEWYRFKATSLGGLAHLLLAPISIVYGQPLGLEKGSPSPRTFARTVLSRGERIYHDSTC